jgi:hypothetical protein
MLSKIRSTTRRKIGVVYSRCWSGIGEEWRRLETKAAGGQVKIKQTKHLGY